MKKYIYILIIYLYGSTGLFSQITVHFAQNTKGRLFMFSYYPQNTKNLPIGTVEIKDEIASFETTRFKPGIYTLYFSETNSIKRAPYIEILIDKEGDQYQIYWNPHTNFVWFENSPQNQFIHSLEKQVFMLYAQENLLDTGLKNFQAAKDLQKDILAEKNAVKEKRKKLLATTLTNSNKWDDYLFAADTVDFHTKNATQFWKTVNIEDLYLWSTPYRNVVFRRWQTLCQENQVKDSSSTIEIAYIKGIITAMGKNPKLHLFLNDWLYQNYDYNSANDFFLAGLEALVGLTNAQEDQKKIWETIYTNYLPLATGTNHDVEEISKAKLIQENDLSLNVVYYSESCGACADALKKLNDIAVKTIAVRVSSSEQSLVKRNECTNIVFYDPIVTDSYLKFVQRGTPAIYSLAKKDTKWVIEHVE